MAFKYVGKSMERIDAHDKVTGKAVFTADIKVPRMLHAQAVRPTHAHAAIRSIDTREAETMPGVVKVITGEGCAIRYGACGFPDTPPLAVGKVRHIGEPVAVVIADTVRNAKAAVKKVTVEYEKLPVLLDPVEAANNRDVLIHEKNGHYGHIPCYFPEQGTNIFHHYKLRKGDAENGFAEADVIVEREFEYPLSAHSAMEPHACIARWREDLQELEIWASSQAPFVVREVFSGLWDIPVANIRVHVPYLGGGFGGKSDLTIEPMTAYAARAVPGYAVKFVCSRKEVMTSTLLGRGMKATAKLGAKKDGTLTAMSAQLYFSDGGYGDTACPVVTVAGHNCSGPYDIPHIHNDAYGVYTNTPPVGAYRGYGHPEGMFIAERLMDLLARELNMDAMELRRKNFLCEGRVNSLGETIKASNGDLFKCLEHVKNAIYASPKPAEDDTYLYGRGIGAMMKSPKGIPNAGSSCHLKFNQDGSVNINLSGIEMGMGAQQAIRQIAAEALMIPPHRINMFREVDTQFSPWEWQTVASMFTLRGGNAVYDAAQKAIAILKENGATVLDCTADEVAYDGEKVFKKTDPASSVAVSALVKGYMYPSGLTVGVLAEATGFSRLQGYEEPSEKDGMGPAGVTWTYGVQGCDLRIEKATGKVIIDHFASSFDVGRVISPVMIRGQIVGGVVMGIGSALHEKLDFDPETGAIKNAVWRRYRTPTMDDIPKKQTVECVETPEDNSAFGARCIAEHPMVAVPPTILNALQDATGHEFNKIPVTPEDILAVIGGGK